MDFSFRRMSWRSRSDILKEYLRVRMRELVVLLENCDVGFGKLRQLEDARARVDESADPLLFVQPHFDSLTRYNPARHDCHCYCKTPALAVATTLEMGWNVNTDVCLRVLLIYLYIRRGMFGRTTSYMPSFQGKLADDWEKEKRDEALSRKILNPRGGYTQS